MIRGFHTPLPPLGPIDPDTQISWQWMAEWEKYHPEPQDLFAHIEWLDHRFSDWLTEKKGVPPTWH